MQEKSLFGAIFLQLRIYLALVAGIVLLTAYPPQICFHGLCAAGGVFLGEVGFLVDGDLGEIRLAVAYHPRYCGKALTDFEFVARQLGRPFSAHGSELQTGGFGVHVNRAKLFRNLARNVVNRVFKYYFSHSRELWLRTIRDCVG